MIEKAPLTPALDRRPCGSGTVIVSGLAVLAVSASISWFLASAVAPATAQRIAATEPSGSLHAVLVSQRGLAEVTPRIGRIIFERGRPTIVSGTASPGTRVTLHANSTVVGGAAAKADGSWTLAVERGLPLGDHRLQVGVVSADGAVSVAGDIIRVSTPLGVTGALTVTIEPTDARYLSATEAASAPTLRIAQAMTPAPPATGAEQPADTLRDWVLRSEKSYQDNIVKRLTTPPAGAGGATPTAKPAAVVGQAAPPATPAPPVATGGSVVDGLLDWLKRSNDTYQNAIVKRLADPYPSLESLEARKKAEALKSADVKSGDDAMAPARAELKAAQAQRDLELKAEEAAARKSADAAAKPAAPATAADAAAKKAQDDRRIADETMKRQADLQAAEAKRKSDEAAVRDTAARKAAEDRRIADEAASKRSADQQAEAKRVADLQAAEAKRKADEAAAREAAARKAADDKRLADEASARRSAEQQAEAKRVADLQAAEAKRKADEAAVRDAAARKAAEDKRLADEAVAKRAAEQKAADAQRRRAAELAEAASKEASSRIAAAPPPSPRPTPPPTAAPAPSPKPVAKATVEAKTLPPRRGPPIDTSTRSALGAGRSDKAMRHADADAAESCRRAGRRIKPPGYYVVKSGDSLWEIAELHYGDGDRYAVLERANRKLDPDVIHPCQRVYVPALKRRR